MCCILPLFTFCRIKIWTTTKVVFHPHAPPLPQNQNKHDNQSRLSSFRSSSSPESKDDRQPKLSFILTLLPFPKIKIRMTTKVVFHPPTPPLPQNQKRTTNEVIFFVSDLVVYKIRKVQKFKRLDLYPKVRTKITLTTSIGDRNEERNSPLSSQKYKSSSIARSRQTSCMNGSEG